MVYIDKKGNLRNSREDLDAFTAYCRERVKLMKNSDAFIKQAHQQWEVAFLKKENTSFKRRMKNSVRVDKHGRS